MGRFGVPSALAIGSIAPDLWYFVPSSSASRAIASPGSAWFCPGRPAALSAVPSVPQAAADRAALAAPARLYTGAPAGRAVARGAPLAARRRAHPRRLGRAHTFSRRGLAPQLAAAPGAPPAAAWCWAGGSGASCGARPRRRARFPLWRAPSPCSRSAPSPRSPRCTRRRRPRPILCAAPIFPHRRLRRARGAGRRPAGLLPRLSA